MIDFQHVPARADREIITGTLGPPVFTLDALWPNELGDKPEDLVGRNVRQGDNYWVIIDLERISPTGHKYTLKPYQPTGTL